jgi:hypothetical protein
MYINRSTSILHTHGLVPCTQDFILHNPIEYESFKPATKQCQNLQQTMSDPAS